MACLVLTLSHRPHTRYADTCTQGFPDIICPGLLHCFSASLISPRQTSTRTDTNKHKRAAVHKHKHKHSYCRPNSFIIRFIPCWCCFRQCRTTHSCLSSWELSIPTIPTIHLSLWLGARRDESCVSAEDLVQGFITSSIPSQFPLTVFLQTGSLKFLSELSPTQSGVYEQDRGLLADLTRREKKTDRKTQRRTILIDSSWETKRERRESLTAKIYMHILRSNVGGDWEEDIAEVHQGARRRLWQRLRGMTVMKRDNASKQTEADEQMMIDDRHREIRERETALFEVCVCVCECSLCSIVLNITRTTMWVSQCQLY